MKCVILAAGLGTRLSPYSQELPKLLLPVAGRPIIDHTLESFSEVGVRDMAIVIGHRAGALKQWVGDGSRYGLRVSYIYNQDYRLGNALSVYAARSFTGDAPFLLSMADHMVSPDLLDLMLRDHDGSNRLAVDFANTSRHVEEGTRVLVDGDGLVNEIGKQLPHWNGIDAGVFRLGPAIFEALDEVVRYPGAEYQLSHAITGMIDAGQGLQACDISGCCWYDVDTWDDLRLVRETLAE